VPHAPPVGELKTEARGLKPEMKFIMALNGSDGNFDRSPSSPAGASGLIAARVVVRVPLRLLTPVAPLLQRDARARRGTRRCTMAGQDDRLAAAAAFIGL